MKKGNIRSRLYRKFKHIPRLLFAFLSSLIIIVNCKEEEQKRQLQIDNERMEAFFESFDEDVSLLAMENNKTTISEDLFKDYTKKAKYREYQLAIEEYSLYFNLDSEKVFELTKELTNDFSEPLTITIGRKSFTATNAEDTAMFITCDIWKDIYNTRKSAKKYNLSKEEYVISEEITHFEYNDEGKVIVRDDGLTFEQLLGKASYALGKSPSRALAISDQESWYRTSNQMKTLNNPSGIKGNGVYVEVDTEFAAFPTAGASAIYHAFNVERMENTTNYNNLFKFAIYYVWGGIRDDDPDKEVKLAEAKIWYNNVSIREAIYAANEEYYFDIPEEEQDIRLALTSQD